jgi:hypothetical protein
MPLIIYIYSNINKLRDFLDKVDKLNTPSLSNNKPKKKEEKLKTLFNPFTRK